MEKKKKSKKKNKKKKPVYLVPLIGAFSLLFIVLASWTLWQSSQKKETNISSGPRKILLVGNDIFVRNDVPNLLRKVFKASKELKKVDIQSIAIPDSNYSLENHLKDKNLAELVKKDWDVVVLQDSAKRVIESPYELLKNIRAIRKKFEPGKTKFVFVSPFTEKEKETEQLVISAVSRKICKNLGIAIAPVGEVFFDARTNCPGILIYSEDNSKANSNGSFVIASTIFSTLSDKPLRFDSKSFSQPYGSEQKAILNFSDSDFQSLRSTIDNCVKKRNGSIKVGQGTPDWIDSPEKTRMRLKRAH